MNRKLRTGSITLRIVSKPQSQLSQPPRPPPATDGVVVPRELLEHMRGFVYDAAIDATFPEDQKFASELVTKADAILAQKE